MDKKTNDNVIQMPDRHLIEKQMQAFSEQRGNDELARAQDTMYDAWETDDPFQRIELAEKALKISRDCADAWVLLAEEAAESVQQSMEYFSMGVEAGERALGEKTFAQDKGYFWGILETRPYMRARLGQAQCLWSKGEHDAAIRHYQAMLELNPNDNQGIRHLLIGCLIEKRRDDDAIELIDTYEGDRGSEWLYSRVLLAYRREGDSEYSRKQRKEAIKQNKNVAAYLAGRRKIPKQLPEYYTPGDKNEAASYVMDNKAAWQGTPGSIPWLLKGIK